MHKKGIDIPQLDGKIHVPFGVFSPLRGEYLDLIAQAPLAPNIQTAFDIIGKCERIFAGKRAVQIDQIFVCRRFMECSRNLSIVNAAQVVTPIPKQRQTLGLLSLCYRNRQ